MLGPFEVGLLESFVQPVEHCLDVFIQWAKLRGASWEAFKILDCSERSRIGRSDRSPWLSHHRGLSRLAEKGTLIFQRGYQRKTVNKCTARLAVFAPAMLTFKQQISFRTSTSELNVCST
jgi:hypothetical protein